MMICFITAIMIDPRAIVAIVVGIILLLFLVLWVPRVLEFAPAIA